MDAVHDPKPIHYEGDFTAIRSRNITEETCRKFNVRVDGGPVIRFPYYNQARSLVAYKERDKDKNFRWVGHNADHRLFGQQLWGAGKTIVITEGELDALSVYQARPTWPVISVPNGAQGAKKALQAQLPWLLGFEEIVLMFDDDEAGVNAAESCVSLFPSDQVFIATPAGYKDASEALSARDSEAIRQAVWNKRSYSPKSIINGADLFELVTKPLKGKDADYPYLGLNNLTSGLRMGELVTLTAGSGIGKSTVCGEICQTLVDQGFSVGYIALEESIQRTALRLMTVKANKPLHLNNEIDETLLRSTFDSSLGTGRVFLRDGFGSIDPDVILNDIRFMVKSQGVSWVILDHLSILLSGNGTSDERRMIDITMTKLRSFVEETRIGMLLVSHLRRSQNDKGHEDGGKVSMSQLRGSNSIGQLSDIVISIQRNITSGENTSDLVVLKNRFNGQTGPAGVLTYNKETGRLTELISTPAHTKADYEDF